MICIITPNQKINQKIKIKIKKKQKERKSEFYCCCGMLGYLPINTFIYLFIFWLDSMAMSKVQPN